MSFLVWGLAAICLYVGAGLILRPFNRYRARRYQEWRNRWH